MTEALAAALPGHAIRVVADAAYAGKELAGLSAQVTWTTRLRKGTARYDLAPPRTWWRARPRLPRPDLLTPAEISAIRQARRVLAGPRHVTVGSQQWRGHVQLLADVDHVAGAAGPGLGGHQLHLRAGADQHAGGHRAPLELVTVRQPPPAPSR
jgi:hypothetical protein